MSGFLNVAHVVLSLDCGGLERIVLDLARKGLDLGQRVSVICLERPGTLARQVEEAGARVITLDKPPGRRPETVGTVAAALRELRPDVMHTHQIGALFYAGPAARTERVPLVVHTEHINQIVKAREFHRQLRIRMLWRIAGRHAARFFCVSDDIATEVRAYGAVPGRKVGVVLNGIDTAAFHLRSGSERLRAALGIAPAVPVIGTVGRLNEVKCQDLLIRSFQSLLTHVPDAHLVLVGDGPRRLELEALTNELGLSRSVHFTGYQAQPETFLGMMDLFALPSRAEGLPLAILEAWAASLPVVATRVGGIPRLIDDGRNGRLFNSGDQQTLTSILIELLADPSLARRLGNAGRRKAESEYDTRRMAGDYHRHYMELLASARSSARRAS